jgi:hypothetical protein
MLNFKSDRLTYAELLAPPASGFELTEAVGTTYSLDLFALLAIPVAMFYNRSLDGNYVQNRYDILEAIRKSKERVTVFCQRGKIHAPDSYTNLLAFVEDCIVEVLPENEFTSFHPKIWVLRFERKRQVCYRLAVLSRNLTFDRSWDISCFSEGFPQLTVTPDGQKLADFLKHFYQLSGRMPNKKFLRDLARVGFDFPAEFDASALFPIVGGKLAVTFTNPMIASGYDELMVVSPFVDDATINHFKTQNKKLTLLSRGEELDKLAEDSLENMNVYAFNPSIRDGELALDNEEQVSLYQDLHAKFYLGKKGAVTDWLIGSANSTSAAFERNTEFLIKYVGKNPKSDLATIKNLLIDPQSRVFLPYERQAWESDDSQKSLERLLRRINYRLSAATFTGTVLERPEQQNFDLEVSVNLQKLAADENVQLFASLLHRSDETLELTPGQQSLIVFENIALTRLSHFLAIDIRVDKLSVCRLVVKIAIKNIPDERDDVIFNELINSRQSFYRYLQFLLSPDEFDGLAEIITEAEEKGTYSTSGEGQKEFSPPIYEHLLLAASRSPAKLKEINQVMFRLERLNSEIIAEFKPIWEVFKKFADG